MGLSQGTWEESGPTCASGNGQRELSPAVNSEGAPDPASAPLGCDMGDLEGKPAKFQTQTVDSKRAPCNWAAAHPSHSPQSCSHRAQSAPPEILKGPAHSSTFFTAIVCQQSRVLSVSPKDAERVLHSTPGLPAEDPAVDAEVGACPITTLLNKGLERQPHQHRDM